MKQLIFFVFVLYSLQSYSQTGFNKGFASRNSNIIESVNTHTYDNPSEKNNYSNIKGSHYLNRTFSNSTLIFKNKDSITNIKLRYNIIGDSFEIKHQDSLYNIKKNDEISKIIIGEKSYCYIKIENNPSNTIAQIIYDKKIKLYSKQIIHFKKAESIQPYTKPKPDRFEKSNPKLFIKLEDSETLIRVKKMSEFAKIFPQHSKEIKKHIKERKLKFRSQEQITQLAGYIESLTIN